VVTSQEEETDAAWLNKFRSGGFGELSEADKLHVADGVGSLIQAAHDTGVLYWPSKAMETVMEQILTSTGEEEENHSTHYDQDVDMRPPPPSMAWPGPSSSSRGHPPRGARPLPRPPVGGRGGSSKGKGRDLGPPPPVNRATHPPPPGKGSYAQTARFDGGVSRSSVDGIVRLAKAFPELPTKRLEVMQRAAGPPHKAPRVSAMVHGPSRRQVLVTIRPAQGTPNPEHLLKTIRTQLALHHSSLVVESAVVSRDGYSVVTSTVASDSDLLQVQGAARMCHLDAKHVDAALPTSTSYLKLVDVPFFTVGDVCITPDGVMAQIGKSGFASLVVLQTPARVVRDSPKSDTCTVYLNVADSVSGARAKGLVRKTVQFGQYASYFRAARANPGSPLCSCCWRWGHPSSACRAPQLRCPICLGPHHKDHHWGPFFFFFFFLNQQFITRCSNAVCGPIIQTVRTLRLRYALPVITQPNASGPPSGGQTQAKTHEYSKTMSPFRAVKKSRPPHLGLRTQ
jgi:hypothetical protein